MIPGESRLALTATCMFPIGEAAIKSRSSRPKAGEFSPSADQAGRSSAFMTRGR